VVLNGVGFVIAAGCNHVIAGVLLAVLPLLPGVTFAVAAAPLPHELRVDTAATAPNTSRTTDQDLTLRITVSLFSLPETLKRVSG
jgi:hypothetical protein